MKKFIALLLALSLVSVCAFAFAASSPNTGNQGAATPVNPPAGNRTTNTNKAPQNTAKPGLVIILEDSDASAEKLEEVAAAVEAGNPAASVYSETAQDKIAAIVGDAAEMIELTGIKVYNYESGDVTAKLEFATKFTVDQTVVIVISVNGQDHVYPASVNEDGTLETTFDEATLTAIAATYDAVIAVLMK